MATTPLKETEMQTSPAFEACLPFVLKEEGGYSNTPGDHGGATNYGIIQREYDVYRHGKGLPLQSVRAIGHDEYREIYWQSYWWPHCPTLPEGLDLSVFNINVNGGPGRGTRLLQQCIGIPVDGVWGPQTDKAVAAIPDVIDIIQAFHDDERKFYQAIINHDPSQKKFASDWFGRNDRCEIASMGMIKKEPMV
jgi:lysozyme family protein